MKATLTVLGSGTSMGVPTIGCDCAVCHSSDPHDRRTRPSILIGYAGKNVLIDTTPDFREQAIREGIRSLDAVLYTHGHADHILGLDDLRPLTLSSAGKDFPLFARPADAEILRRMFRYIFDADYKFGGLAQVELRAIDGPVDLFGARFEPVKVIHGEAEILGFRFGQAAYLTDLSEDSRGVVCEASGTGYSFSGRAAAQAPSHPFHCGELAAHCGAASNPNAHFSPIFVTIWRMRPPMHRCRRMCGFPTTE